MMARLVKEKKLTDENFKVGLTKVFFKAGIVAHLEDIRYKLKIYFDKKPTSETPNSPLSSLVCRLRSDGSTS